MQIDQVRDFGFDRDFLFRKANMKVDILMRGIIL